MSKDYIISQKATKENIKNIAKKLDINENNLEIYGNYKAKIKYENLKNNYKKSNLILVSAINPTPSGEGKTTVTIGLSDALNMIGKKSCVVLREPSLGPVLGKKGGACGGGYSQVVPMEDINLHFTGDMHAITTANNVISAYLDNHIFQGNKLNIKKIIFNRVLDINDRSLRHIEVATKNNGIQREDHFDITVASELMAILCLSENLLDLKEKISNIIVAYDINDNPIYIKDLKIEGAITAILKDAINPNLVQTLENNPAIIHGGPFANIAHGCNSVIATKTALKCSEYVVTEAGFGADLGAEKFFNIKCRKADLRPEAVVLVATVRALKLHGGASYNELNEENINALKKGIQNLEKHIENMKKFNLPVLVSLNIFESDTNLELETIDKWAIDNNVIYSKTEVFSKGGKGAIDLANKLINIIKNNKENFKLLYENNLSIFEKIKIICTEIYGANNVNYTEEALKEIKKIEKLGFSKLPICMAKTPLSLSDNKELKGRPRNFSVKITDVKLKAGAGFIVAYTNKILTMPGLSEEPNMQKIDIDKNGNIINIF